MQLEMDGPAMIKWICGIKPSDRLSVDSHYNGFEIKSLSTLLRLGRLRWLGHVSRSEGWIIHCYSLDVVRKCGKGCSQKHGRRSFRMS